MSTDVERFATAINPKLVNGSPAQASLDAIPPAILDLIAQMNKGAVNPPSAPQEPTGAPTGAPEGAPENNHFPARTTNTTSTELRTIIEELLKKKLDGDLPKGITKDGGMRIS